MPGNADGDDIEEGATDAHEEFDPSDEEFDPSSVEFDPSDEEFDPSSVEPAVVTGEDGGEFDTAIDPSEVDVDPETARLFWGLVLVFDVALFALVVGPALWYFEGRAALGRKIFAVGVVLFVYGVYKVRTRDDGDE